MNLGGVVGSFVVGFGMDRVGPQISLALAGAAMLGLAWTHTQIFVSAALPMLIVAAGVTVVRMRVDRAKRSQ